MTLPGEKQKSWIGFGILGLALCCCVVMAAALFFVDPLELGIGERVYAIFIPTPSPTPTPLPTPTPRPTSDPCLSTHGPLSIGCPAPDFTLTSFDGQVINLAELSGKLVLIHFCTSWAAPCEGDAAILQAVWEELSARGDVVFLGVSYVDTDQAAGEFIQEFGLTYLIGPDTASQIAQAYHIRGVPETYIVDRDGRLASVKIGPFESADEVRVVLEMVLTP